jgi:hypothetical protein
MSGKMSGIIRKHRRDVQYTPVICPCHMIAALGELVSAHTKGDPMEVLLWTNKSLRVLVKELENAGYKACHCVVGEMLKILGYSLQADKKTLTATKSHTDRDAQFEYINEQCKQANARGIAVIFSKYINFIYKQFLSP